jgi:methylmalonyl-CoA/ethylmalonyl-CoA epimerase
MGVSHPAVLDHVAVAVEKVADVPAFLVGQLGGRPDSAGPGPGFRFWQWRFARGGRLEVLEPDGPADGFLHRFLAQRGPGVHHVTLKVPRIEEAIARAEAAGYRIVGASLGQPAWKEAFLHPKQAQGVVVQLAESHPELEPEEWEQSRWPFPELPEGSPEPADLLGLRLVARSAERARRQWRDTLLGACTEADGELLFRWPDSPLRIAVRIDAAAGEEGPLGIEVAARPGLALPDGPHAVLGARFFACGRDRMPD